MSSRQARLGMGFRQGPVPTGRAAACRALQCGRSDCVLHPTAVLCSRPVGRSAKLERRRRPRNRGRDSAYPLRTSSDGKWMAAGSNGQALLLNAADGQLLQSVYIGPFTINALAFSPDGQSMHISTQTGGCGAGISPPVLRRSNRSASRRSTTSTSRARFDRFSVAMRPMIAAGSSGGKVTVWDFAKGTKKLEFDGHVMHTTQTAFSPDGKSLASASGDTQIILWNLADGKEIRRFKGHGGEVKCVAFSPDGKRLASGGEDMTVRLWDVATGDSIMTFRGHVSNVMAVAFSPDGKQLATGGADKIVRIWDTTEPVHRAGPISCWPSSHSISKIYQLLLSEGGQTYYGHIGPTLSFAFSGDGRFAATSGNGDPSIIIWNLMRPQSPECTADSISPAQSPGVQPRRKTSGDGRRLDERRQAGRNRDLGHRDGQTHSKTVRARSASNRSASSAPMAKPLSGSVSFGRRRPNHVVERRQRRRDLALAETPGSISHEFIVLFTRWPRDRHRRRHRRRRSGR